MTTVFVDTDVLLYSVDAQDPSKRGQAGAWLDACWKRRCGRLSTQVLNEFYVNSLRKFKGAKSAADARAEVRRYQQWRPWIIDQATVETAWDVESRYRINYWDALMVAAARHQQCAVLLTEDMQHGQHMAGVQIVDPFQIGPDMLDGG